MKRFLSGFLLTAPLFISLSISAQTDDLKILATYMAGSYSSEAQHLKDTVNYYDIRLQIIPIWKDRKDGYWFYVEQAMNGFLDKPYRQRVYHVHDLGKDAFESVVFTMKEPLRFTHHPELVEKAGVDSLMEKEGCSVILSKSGSHTFSGGTDGNKCPSDRKGAAYATSEVTITADLLKSWDRGYNEKNEQVWGATAGPYEFVKIR